jgi:hypothetical protein
VPVTPIARDWFNSTLTSQAAKGLGKYDTALRTNNGRNALQDAMDELADAVQYVTQAEMERRALEAALAAARTALEWYADLANHQDDPKTSYSEVDYDGGDMARRALAALEPRQ